MLDERDDAFVPKLAPDGPCETEPVADPVAEAVRETLAADKKAEEPPKPKAVAQVVITLFDIAPVQVQSTLQREETLMVLKQARQAVAAALAQEK